MIDLRQLTYFLSACEQENLAAAARDLDVAPSTLSASLKQLQRELDLNLFRKHSGGISPLPAAGWLFRASLPLVLLENYILRRLAAPDAEASTRLDLHIGLRFTFGRVSKAINRAIAITAREEPLVLVTPRWMEEDDTPFDLAPSGSLGTAARSRLDVEAIVRPADPQAGEIPILSDPWVLVRRQPYSDGESRGRLREVMIPALPSPLLRAMLTRLAETGISATPLPEDPAALPQLLEAHPGSDFLLPKSVIAARLGMSQVVTRLFEPRVDTTIIGRADPADAVALRFLSRVRESLNEAEGQTLFTTQLTERRIRYFNLTFQERRVSSAARIANVAQPALSQQLEKMEGVLGQRLFERRPNGVAPTLAAERLAPMAQSLEAGLQRLQIRALSVALGQGADLRIGVLPSVNQRGFLVDQIAATALALRQRHSEVGLVISEAPNTTLQSWVQRGRVGLAIVETVLPQSPRLPLDCDEPLALIADPRQLELAGARVALADLARYTLALPSRQFGLRALLDTAAQEQSLTLKPAFEIDSLSLLVALLARAPVCTVLPPSAVRSELERGDLAAVIIEPDIRRRLYVIYSGERALSPAEKDFVSLLKAHLATPWSSDQAA